MAENNDQNQNDLEESVRSMIKDRIAKLREENTKKAETAAKKPAAQGTSSAKTVQPEIKTKKSVQAETGSKETVKSEINAEKSAKADIKTENKIIDKSSASVSSSANTTSEKAAKPEKKEAGTDVKSDEVSKQPEEDEYYKDKGIKAADAEAEQKRRQAEKEAREAEKEEKRRQKEALKKEKQEEKQRLKEAAREEKERLKEQKQSEKLREERLREEKAPESKIVEDMKGAIEDPGKTPSVKVAEAAAAVGAAGAAATVGATGTAGAASAGTTVSDGAGVETDTPQGKEEPEGVRHKGEGVWKNFVDRMNAESAGDDALGRDIEDESADEIFISPDEKKRKRTFGFVKLYVTLGAIAAIAIIIAFFTVRNTSFRHNYEQGIQAFNEKDYDTAIETFERLRITEEGEHNIDLLNYLAQSYVKKDRLSDAVEVYNKALQTDPTFGPAVTGLCEMYTRMKDGKSLNATLDKYRGTNMEEYIADYMVSNPSMNPDAGKYDEDFEVAITGDQNVPIFITTDGSDPNEQSQLYSNPIKISEGTTQIKAISINTLGIRSGIVDKSYTVEYRIPNEPKIALNSGIYVTGQTVTISGDEGCDIYYTTDGSAPTRYSDKYTGPLRLVKGNVILTAIAISNHGKESTLASKNYIIVQNARELEQVEQMNQPTTVSGQNSSDGQNPETAEGQETSQNPNETDGWYTDETSENNSEENLFDWLLNGRRN